MSYKIGIIKAISDLKDRTGSSMQAIKKHMQGALPSDKKWANTTFLTALKTGVASGDFVKVKGSYKLSQDFKKKLADAAKPKKPKKVTPKKESCAKEEVSAKEESCPEEEKICSKEESCS
mmetsp:Transcript_13504/g.19319  ORF Transcript_13504/g.19319 Transcript_13504/m.19319 type:complete len:120 (+) Transcript_13504:59-418(+)